MYRKYGKRVVDVFVASIAILILAPILLISAILIKLTSKGPILFRQERYGKNKNPFTVYKFRSMSTEAPSNIRTNDFTDSSNYITPIGAVIRKLSIDELPQLFNVIKGDMSIIGPRPVILTETNLISLRDKYGANSIKPGITGWAQVNGRDELNDNDKARLDGYYADNMTPILDVKCLLLTAWRVLTVNGHREGSESSQLRASKGKLVSIIIPIYNVEKYLTECFNSVARQDYVDIEIILVNDGSTDRSGELADNLASTDARARVIHKENGGLSDARNVGIKSAKGEFITLVDSDDYIAENFISNLMQEMGEDIDIAQCDNTRDNSKLGLGSGKIITMSGSDAFNKLMNYKTISPTAWGKIYRIALFKDHNLTFPVGRIHEDTAILYKLIFLAKNVSCVDKNLYYYRKNEGSIMRSAYTRDHYESVELYHKELVEFIKQNSIEISKSEVNRHMAMRYLSVFNKMAIAKMDREEDFTRIKKTYEDMSQSLGIIKRTIGSVFVTFPSLFRASAGIMPLVRKALGKT